MLRSSFRLKLGRRIRLRPACKAPPSASSAETEEDRSHFLAAQAEAGKHMREFITAIYGEIE